MTDTISDGVTTVTPDLTDGWNDTLTSRNVIHEVLGTAEVSVSLRPTAARSGTAKLTFLTSEADARAAQTLLGTAAVLTYATTDRSTLGMDFVLAGAATVELDDDSRDAWIVTFDFQEII